MLRSDAIARIAEWLDRDGPEPDRDEVLALLAIAVADSKCPVAYNAPIIRIAERSPLVELRDPRLAPVWTVVWRSVARSIGEGFRGPAPQPPPAQEIDVDELCERIEALPPRLRGIVAQILDFMFRTGDLKRTEAYALILLYGETGDPS